MATSKRSVSSSRTGKPTFTAAAPVGDSAFPPSAPPAGAISLSTLLMVGADRVIIDAAEDDYLHFMAEYIDPA